MIKVITEIDKEKNGGVVEMRAVGSIPEMCAEFEILIAEMIKGLYTQLPNDKAPYARIMFSIAAQNGAKRALKDD